MTFVRSDEDENVGPFDDGFPGFTVAPGRTLTVKVRLSLTAGATAPNTVVANAAVVQRHEDDGDWVGESNDYRFRVEDDGTGKSEETGEEAGKETGEDVGGAATTGTDAGASAGTGIPSGGTGSGTTVGGTAGTGAAAPSADQLASTGPGASNRLGLAALALTLLASGAGLLALARRVRPRPALTPDSRPRDGASIAPRALLARREAAVAGARHGGRRSRAGAAAVAGERYWESTAYRSGRSGPAGPGSRRPD